VKEARWKSRPYGDRILPDCGSPNLYVIFVSGVGAKTIRANLIAKPAIRLVYRPLDMTDVGRIALNNQEAASADAGLRARIHNIYGFRGTLSAKASAYFNRAVSSGGSALRLPPVSDSNSQNKLGSACRAIANHEHLRHWELAERRTCENNISRANRYLASSVRFRIRRLRSIARGDSNVHSAAESARKAGFPV
jgi:hypothetical protein